MNKFIFDLIIDPDSYPLVEKYNQEELNNYFGGKSPLTVEEIYKDFSIFCKYVDDYIKDHNFKIISEKIIDDDLYESWRKVEVIYTLDDSYYKLHYIYSPFLVPKYNIAKDPVKVIPEEKVVIEFI